MHIAQCLRLLAALLEYQSKKRKVQRRTIGNRENKSWVSEASLKSGWYRIGRTQYVDMGGNLRAAEARAQRFYLK